MAKRGEITVKDKSQAGIALLEALVAFGILSVIVLAFLSGLTTSLNGIIITREQETAMGLARSGLDDVKNQAYGSSYTVDLSLPEGWTVPAPRVEPVHFSDDGLQRITVTPEYNGIPVLSISTYKMNR